MRNEKELYQTLIENIDLDRRIVFVPDSKTISGTREVLLSLRAFDILRRRSGDCLAQRRGEQSSNGTLYAHRENAVTR